MRHLNFWEVDFRIIWSHNLLSHPPVLHGWVSLLLCCLSCIYRLYSALYFSNQRSMQGNYVENLVPCLIITHVVDLFSYKSLWDIPWASNSALLWRLRCLKFGSSCEGDAIQQGTTLGLECAQCAPYTGLMKNETFWVLCKRILGLTLRQPHHTLPRRA